MFPVTDVYLRDSGLKQSKGRVAALNGKMVNNNMTNHFKTLDLTVN